LTIQDTKAKATRYKSHINVTKKMTCPICV